MSSSTTFPFPCYYIENTTRNGFIFQPIENGTALLCFSSPKKVDDYKRANGWTACRTMVIPDGVHFARLLDALPDEITHIIVDVYQHPEVDQVCWRVPELKVVIQEINRRVGGTA